MSGAIGSFAGRSLIGRVGSFLGQSPARAAAGGAAGGVLLDDVPIIGDTLDPTETNSQPLGLSSTQLIIILAVVAVLILALSDSEVL